MSESFNSRSKPIDYGRFSDTAYMGSPASAADRQFSASGVPAGGGNLADEADGGTGVKAPTAYMAASFMDRSGTGANRDYVARKEGN